MGPVCWWELIRSSRRPALWWIRVVYLGVLAFFFALACTRVNRFSMGPAWDMQRIHAGLGSEFYQTYCLSQFMLAITLAWIWSVTSIFEEKTGQTLPLLFAAGITRFDIVAGKAALTLLRIVALLLSGLPFGALSLLLGGVTLTNILVDFVLTVSTAWMVIGLAVLSAAWSRNLLNAAGLVGVAIAGWFFLPLLLNEIYASRGGSHNAPEFVKRLNVSFVSFEGYQMGAHWLVRYLPCFLFQVGAGGVALALAWVGLGSSSAVRVGDAGGGDALRGPADEALLDEQPMLWRELRGRSATAFETQVRRISIGAAAATFAWVGWEFYHTTLLELSRFPPPPVVMICAVVSSALVALNVIHFGLAGATAFSNERAGSLFDQLRTTLLSHEEIVRAKVVRLVRQAALALTGPLFLMCVCFALGWTTVWGFTGAALVLAASAVPTLLFGLVLGMRCRPTPAIVGTASFLVAITLLLPVAGYVALGLPSPLQYSLVIPLAPAFQTGVLLVRDTTIPYVPLCTSSETVWYPRLIAVASVLGYAGATVLLYRFCRSRLA